MANTSISVTFVTDVGNLLDEDGNAYASIQAQLDSTYNNGATRFLYGSKAYYQIFKSPSGLSISQEASAGTITSEGTGTEEVTEYVTFANSNEGSLSYPLDSVESATWLGKNLGALSYVGNNVLASQSGVGVLKLVYNAAFTRYAISLNSSEDTYVVLVYITGTLS